MQVGGSHTPDPKKVFVVHGRDSKLRDDFFSFLRALGLHPIEWAEALKLTCKASPYIGEAIESAFKSAQAVVVLLSPDDEVRLSRELWKNNENQNEKETSFQARPNVLFEAGMAFGVNPDRTILIETGTLKPFSDVAGRHVVRLSNSSHARNDIAERLRTSGCEVSTSGSDWLSIGNFEVERELSVMSTVYDPSELTEGDILALLDSWWPKAQESFPEDVTVKFNEVDTLLSLPSGSTKKYIHQIARRKNFKLVSSGNLVATFEYDVTSDDFGSYIEP
jgi:predicted nucleotide-binding protein